MNEIIYQQIEKKTFSVIDLMKLQTVLDFAGVVIKNEGRNDE